MSQNAKYDGKQLRKEKDESGTRPLQAFAFLDNDGDGKFWG